MEECFDHSWRLQNEFYYSDRPVKRKHYKGAIPAILFYANPKCQLAASLECEKRNSRQEVNMCGGYSKGAFGELKFFSSYVCLSAQNWEGLIF